MSGAGRVVGCPAGCGAECAFPQHCYSSGPGRRPAEEYVFIPTNGARGKYPEIGSTIVYTCSGCGVGRTSKPLPPPPALGVYPLPDGWVIDPVADLSVDDRLLCRKCKPRKARP